jgi:hypothetical protein
MRAVLVSEPGGPEALALAYLPDPPPGPGAVRAANSPQSWGRALCDVDYTGHRAAVGPCGNAMPLVLGSRRRALSGKECRGGRS